MILPYPKIHVIVNPAAGNDEPMINILNDVFQPTGVKWDVSVTHEAGDGTRLAAAAVADGASLVAAYGGDGTQMEVANGLLGTGCPQAILPGGTGNAMAFELGIPLDLKQAAELLLTSTQRKAVDVVHCGNQAFILRAYAGLSIDQAATREEKDKMGKLAYLQASMKFIREAKPIQFRATIDGEVNEIEALMCFVLNSGSIGGVMGISIPPVGEVSCSDGYLDFFAITQGVQPLRAITKYLFRHGEFDEGIYHWCAKEVTVEADPPQEVWLDGEVGGMTPFTAVVLPKALEIVVPPETQPV